MTPADEDRIAEKVAEKVAGMIPSTALPYYMKAEQVAEILGVQKKNIPPEIRKFYPGGRQRKPLFRRDHVIAFIEN